LLTKDNLGIISYLKELDSQVKNMKMDLLKICWYMRGGVTYQEALNLSPDERLIIGDLVKQNMETTKKTGQPFF
jgi:hypothetical protein|tara:strand:+ start:473 stop:694 length:222 start_codon:yes stop_codon:yes gene_type:complete